MIQMLLEALKSAGYMFWEVLWPLALGFLLSGIVQAIVRPKKVAGALGGESVKSTAAATALGAASSSCSYAAVALARSLFQKGASFASAMIFQIASTNLVIELAITLIALMGWQFAAAEWIGGIMMVIILALIFRVTLSKKLIMEAKQQASKGLAGKMEGHAAMDMSLEGNEPFTHKLFSKKGITAVSHFYVMDWVSVWTDIVLGFLIAGALAAWIPQSFWQAFFLKDNPGLAFIEGPLIGPIIAIISFVCSVGNVPLAAVLWHGGISFGGVVSFIFADLIVLPILDIYRKYYGWKMMAYILAVFYSAIALAGYIVELLFSHLGIIPANRSVQIVSEGIRWNYTSSLNIAFLAISILLAVIFIRSGGVDMLKMMNYPQKGNHKH